MDVLPRGAFGGEDAGDAGEVVGYVEIGPLRCFEERADGGERVVAEFEDEEAAGFEMARDFWNQQAVEFVAFFAAVEGEGGFVFADFDGEGAAFFAADVGRVGDHQIEEKWRAPSGEWRDGR
jgi:hypothetical protein